jgi:glycine/D-amino acid oxidase-like deaminating enzyme
VADVIVVGGGITGVSTASYLARRGVSVTLCERGELAREASAKNLGFIVVMGRVPGPSLDVSLRAREIYETLDQDLGADIGLRRCGGLVVGRPGEEDFDLIEKLAEDRRQHGVEVTVVEGSELRDLAPEISPDVKVAMHYAEEARVDNQLVAQAFARDAERHGARILRQTEVSGIETVDGRVVGVRTRTGTIKADVVVAAAGLWTDTLCRTAGETAPMLTYRGQVVQTERIEPVLDPLMYNLGSILRLGYYEDLFDVANMETPVPPYACAVQTHDGRLLFGCPLDMENQERVTLDGIETISREVGKIFPRFAGIPIARTWAGLIATTTDDQPLVGWASNCEGLYIAGGLMAGNTGGPVIGELVAAEISGDDQLPEYAQSFKPARLNTIAKETSK